jgi:hypothetical protein
MQELLFATNATGYTATLQEAVRQEAWMAKKLVLEEQAMNIQQVEKAKTKKIEEASEPEEEEDAQEIQQMRIPKSEMSCFTCGKKGHLKHECRSQGGNGQQRNTDHSYQSENNKGNTKQCSYCGRTGHLEMYCYTKKSHERRENARNNQGERTQRDNTYEGSNNQIQRWDKNQKNGSNGNNYQRERGTQNQTARYSNQNAEYPTNQKQRPSLESIGEELIRLGVEQRQRHQKEQEHKDYESDKYLRSYIEKNGPPPNKPRLAIQDINSQVEEEEDHYESNSGN